MIWAFCFSYITQSICIFVINYKKSKAALTMELVVVNGANNIAKSVIRGLTAGGKYNRVRMLDY